MCTKQYHQNSWQNIPKYISLSGGCPTAVLRSAGTVDEHDDAQGHNVHPVLGEEGPVVLLVTAQLSTLLL